MERKYKQLNFERYVGASVLIEELKSDIIIYTGFIDVTNENFESDGVETVKKFINKKLDLINAVYQDLITGAIKYHTMLALYRVVESNEVVYEIQK